MMHRLTADDLRGLWRFHHEHGVLADGFCLMPEGHVAGYDNFNEKHWALDDGMLVLLDMDHTPTTRFEEVAVEGERLVLTGRHLPNPDTILRLTQLTTEWPKHPGTRFALADRIAALGWRIGAHTYGVPSFIDERLAMLEIGSYTSIGPGVVIALGDHRTDTASTYPFASLRAYWPSAPKEAADHTSKGPVAIGSDVWLGAGAFIGSGVSIGHGAVIGARSVITKDVPPYAVVVGTDRVVRHRFAPAVVAELLELAWWEWPDAKVDRYLPFIMQPDIAAFVARAQADRD